MVRTNLWERIAPLVRTVERPSRYIDSEWGAHREAPGDHDVSFCMVYPDTYELGQPNQALRILVNAVNAQSGMYAERAFLPAVDMIDVMRAQGVPAFSLESCAPVREFDVVGITLPHELAATNVLEMLDLAGIAVRAADRAEDDPIVVAGGPCAYNPEPYAPFFDAIMIGEGEEAVPELVGRVGELRRAGVAREAIMRELARIPGIYVPSLYEVASEDEAQRSGSWLVPVCDDAPRVIEKRVFEGFAASDAWEPMIVPYMEIVHDRLNVEILRGCARGCRFCQAGMMYRPVRERSVDNIVAAVRRGIEETGYEEVSLTSLSSTDHSQIREMLERLNAEWGSLGVRISIPSQRLDSFGVDMASLVAGRKKGGLTFAPEAGTQRLRDVINKNVTDDDLISATRAACAEGWRRMKLYFMIGLPTERDEDLLGIAEAANRTYEAMKEATPAEQRGSLRLGISVNVFVPKSQTPFQWDGQISSEEAARRVGVIRGALRYRAITLSYHEPKTSLVEAVMSRGGREVAALVEEAWRRGARFDAWTELFSEGAWRGAADELGIDVAAIAQSTYESERVMPWAHISCGVDAAFLAAERERALAGQTTPDCTFDACSACGVCPGLGVSNEVCSVRGGACGVAGGTAAGDGDAVTGDAAAGGAAAYARGAAALRDAEPAEVHRGE